MTELENHLLSALKNLETQFNDQQKTVKNDQMNLIKMFKDTGAENKHLAYEVTTLKKQVIDLNEALLALNKTFRK